MSRVEEYQETLRYMMRINNNGFRPVNSAAYDKRIDVLKCLVNSGIDVTEISKLSSTILDDIDATEILHSSCCSMNARKSLHDEGNTALHIASRKGHLEVLEFLFECNWDANHQNDLGETALHMAVGESHTEVATLLIANGINVNAKDVEDRTALHYASEMGHIEMVVLLLTNNANVNAKDDGGATPFHIAAEQGDADIVTAMLPYTSRTSRTALRLAKKGRHTDVVALIESAIEEQQNPGFKRAWVDNRHVTL